MRASSRGGHARLLDRLGEVEVRERELDIAGFDFGDVEDVVDDREHVLAGARDLFGVGALFFVEAGVQKQLVHADHAVHRGADLVAHVRQERRLHVRRLNGLVTRDRQLGVGAVACRHVLTEHHAAAASVGA